MKNQNRFIVFLIVLAVFAIAVFFVSYAKAEESVDWITFGDDESEPELPDLFTDFEVEESVAPARTDIASFPTFTEYSDLDPFTASFFGLDYAEPSEVNWLAGTPATKTITSDVFPTYFEYSKEEVEMIQNALNNWLENHGYSRRISVDGIFGPETSTAIKFFQDKSGLDMDGVLGSKSMKKLGLSGLSQKYYFYNVNLASVSSKTNLLIYVSLSDRKVIVYENTGYGWNKVGSTSCTIGKNSTPTPAGIYKVEGKKSRLKKYPEARKCTNFTGGYYFHTTLSKHESTGKAKSHGCIRLPEKYANWLYENANVGTAVVIDDRPSYAK